jgi:hypothetical protein
MLDLPMWLYKRNEKMIGAGLVVEQEYLEEEFVNEVLLDFRDILKSMLVKQKVVREEEEIIWKQLKNDIDTGPDPEVGMTFRTWGDEEHEKDDGSGGSNGCYNSAKK